MADAANCASLRTQLPSLRQSAQPGRTRVACFGPYLPAGAGLSSVDAAAVPDWCASSSPQWRTRRFEGCLNYNTYIGLVDIISGAELGRTYFNLQHQVQVRWNSLAITNQVVITRGESEGLMEDDDEMAVELHSYCSYGCSGSLDTAYTPFDRGDPVTFTYSATSTVAEGSMALAGQLHSWTIDHEEFIELPDPWVYQSQGVRCDRVTYKSNAGCSTGYQPTMPHSGIGAVTTHVRAGEECDEYPFAHSYQGGPNSSRASVSSGDQRVQGGVMSDFFQHQRVLDGEPF
ncbi:NucA/NucB deoxyribonuclease domain-containing protein [Plantactinospora sp. B24E8]